MVTSWKPLTSYSKKHPHYQRHPQYLPLIFSTSCSIACNFQLIILIEITIIIKLTGVEQHLISALVIHKNNTTKTIWIPHHITTAALWLLNVFLFITLLNKLVKWWAKAAANNIKLNHKTIQYIASLYPWASKHKTLFKVLPWKRNGSPHCKDLCFKMFPVPVQTLCEIYILGCESWSSYSKN